MTHQMTATEAAGTSPVIEGIFDKLVPSPGFFALAYFEYHQGAFFPPAKGAGPVVFRVLQGSLEFHAEGVVTKTPAGSAEPWDVPPGTQFTVTVGDQLVVPGDVVHSVRNSGSGSARILGLAVFAAAPVRQFPAGISFEPLTLGQAATLPVAPAAASVRRTRLESAGRLELPPADGPRIVHVEAGQVEIELQAGIGQVWQGKGPLDPPGTLTVSEPVALSQGDGVLVQSGATVTISAAGAAGTVLDAEVSAVGSANEVLFRQCVQDVIDAENLAAASRYFAEQYFNHDWAPGHPLGLAGLTTSLRSAFSGFSGISTVIEEQIGEHDIVISRWQRSAENTGPYRGLPASGRTVVLPGITMSRIRDGEIVEEWEAKDMTSLLSQLGVSEPVGELDEEGICGPRAVVSRFIYDVWSAGDAALIDEIFAADFVNHSLLPGQRPGRAGIRQFVGRWHSAFPDVNVTIDLMAAECARVAVRWTSRGTHAGGLLGVPPSGRYIAVSGITMLTVRNSQITELSQQWALASFLEQARVLPAADLLAAKEGR